MRPFRALPLLLLALACDDGSGPRPVTSLDAVNVGSALLLINGTDRPVFHFVIGRQAAAFTDWIACADPAQCDPIAPRTGRVVPHPTSSVRETEALVYWWHSVAGPTGEFAADSIRYLVVRLDGGRRWLPSP